MARQLHRIGMESDFIILYNSKQDFNIPEYIHTYSLGIDSKSPVIKIILQIMQNISGVNSFLAGREYVLMTAHLPMAQILAAFTKGKKKCLYVMHGTQHLTDQKSSPFYKMGLRIFLRGKKIVTVSNGLRNELVNEYGIKPDHVITIYNPCSVSTIKAQAQTEFPHTRHYILVMGRLEKEKNPLLALELYVKGKIFHEYDLIYLGKGSLEEELREKIEEYRLQSHVHLMGFQSDVGKWFKNASLLLSCSRQEGLPLNLVEALICKTPVVATDCPYGPNEILTGELAKYLIEPEQNFQESIQTVVSALKFYPEITEAYYDKFEDDVIVQKYLDAWRKWFGKNRRV